MVVKNGIPRPDNLANPSSPGGGYVEVNLKADAAQLRTSNHYEST